MLQLVLLFLLLRYLPPPILSGKVYFLHLGNCLLLFHPVKFSPISSPPQPLFPLTRPLPPALSPPHLQICFFSLKSSRPDASPTQPRLKPQVSKLSSPPPIFFYREQILLLKSEPKPVNFPKPSALPLHIRVFLGLSVWCPLVLSLLIPSTPFTRPFPALMLRQSPTQFFSDPPIASYLRVFQISTVFSPSSPASPFRIPSPQTLRMRPLLCFPDQ